MKLTYNGDLMAKYIKEARTIDKKNDIVMSFRQTSKVSGIPHVTLSRLQNGNAPDVETFATVCNWLGKPMSLFFNKSKPSSKK